MRFFIAFTVTLASFSLFSHAFAPQCRLATPRRANQIPRNVVPPIAVDSALLADGAVAVASFAAGILSQVPRLQQLEQNVTETQAAAQAQITALEERLYALDQEYEQGTAALRQQFDELRVDQLQRQKRQQAQEFQYKLQAEIQKLTDSYERQLQEQKSALLSQQLDEWNARPDRQAELLQLRVQQKQWEERNVKLTALLADAEAQVQELQCRDKNAFWNVFGLGGGNPN